MQPNGAMIVSEEVGEVAVSDQKRKLQAISGDDLSPPPVEKKARTLQDNAQPDEKKHDQASSEDETITKELVTGADANNSILSTCGIYFRVRATRSAILNLTKIKAHIHRSEDAAVDQPVELAIYLLDADWNESMMSSPNKWKEISRNKFSELSQSIELSLGSDGISLSASKDRTFYLHCKGLIRLTDLIKSPREYPSNRVMAVYPCGVSLTEVPFQNSFTRVPAPSQQDRKNLWYLPIGSVEFTGKKNEIEAPLPNKVRGPVPLDETMKAIVAIVSVDNGAKIWKLHDIQAKLTLRKNGGPVSSKGLEAQLTSLCNRAPSPPLVTIGSPENEHFGWVAHEHRDRAWSHYAELTGTSDITIAAMKKQQEEDVAARSETFTSPQHGSGPSRRLSTEPTRPQLVPSDRRDVIAEIVGSTGAKKLWQKPEILRAYFEKIGDEMTDHMVLHDLKTLCEEPNPRLVMFGETKSQHRGWILAKYSEGGAAILSDAMKEWKQKESSQKQKFVMASSNRGPLQHEIRRELVINLIEGSGDTKLWRIKDIGRYLMETRPGLTIGDNLLLADLKSLSEPHDNQPAKLAMIGDYKTPFRGWIMKEHEAKGIELYGNDPEVLNYYNYNKHRHRQQVGSENQVRRRDRPHHERRREIICDIVTSSGGTKLWKKAELVNRYYELTGDKVSDHQLLGDMKSLTECGSPKITMIGEIRNPHKGWIAVEYADEGLEFYFQDGNINDSSSHERKPNSRSKSTLTHDVRRDLLKLIVQSTGDTKIWRKIELLERYRLETNEDITDPQLLGDLKSMTDCEIPSLAMVGEYKNPHRGWISVEYRNIGYQIYLRDLETRKNNRSSEGSRSRQSGSRMPLAHERRRNVIYQIVSATGDSKLWRKTEIMQAYCVSENEDISDTQLLGDLKSLCECEPPQLALIGEVRSPHRGWIAFDHIISGETLFAENKLRAGESRRDRAKNKGPQPHEVRRSQIVQVILSTEGTKLWKKNDISDAYEGQRTLSDPMTDAQMLGDLKSLVDSGEIIMIGGVRSPHRGWIGAMYGEEGEAIHQQESSARR